MAEHRSQRVQEGRSQKPWLDWWCSGRASSGLAAAATETGGCAMDGGQRRGMHMERAAGRAGNSSGVGALASRHGMYIGVLSRRGACTCAKPVCSV